MTDRFLILKEKIKEKLPEYNFYYDSESGYFINYDQSIELTVKYEYLDDWIELLEMDDLIVIAYDSDDWFALTLD
ncbi:hypothetical protein GW796_09335 [archaeon]|nr:hypothetical protein [archaeon]NCT58931.1 hypothetical protein [archaeon]